MARNHSPSIITDSLKLCLDAANIKSLPYRPGTTDHGISEWYCFVSGTAIYSCSEPDTAIYQVTSAGVVTTVVSLSSSPQRGTLAITAGNRYYGNKPIFLTVEDAHHCIAPISMSSNLFIYLANRAGSEAGTIYFYSPFGSSTITMYTGGLGVNGTATSTLSLTKGQSGTFTTSTLSWFYFTSTSPVIGTATQFGADRTIFSPAVTTSYQRYTSAYVTSIGGTPSTVGSYVISDTTYPVMAQQIGDGAGGDTAQGLGYEYLCDRYSWGNVLSDYTIVAPYANSIITTYYWSGTAWVVWETHSLSGTKLSPAQVQRDGTNGPGVTATIISGPAANMASGATLWKWESNNPFYLCINDSQDDEVSMLGWSSTRAIRTVSDIDNTWTDVSGNGYTALLYNNYRLSNNSVSFSRNSSTIKHGGIATTVGTNSLTSANFLYNNHTWEVWVRIDDRTPGAYSGTEGMSIVSVFSGYHAGFMYDASTMYYYMWDSTGPASIGACSWSLGLSGAQINQGTWCQLVVTRNGNMFTPYLNGVPAGTGSTRAYTAFTGVSNNIWLGGTADLAPNIGNYLYYGKNSVANMKMYSRALSADEVKQNFNALRSRFRL